MQIQNVDIVCLFHGMYFTCWFLPLSLLHFHISQNVSSTFEYGIDVLLRVCYYCFTILSTTHWGRATHICVSKLTIIGSDNGLSPGRRQSITWTNDGILLIRPIGTNFSEILSKIRTFPFKKMHLKTSSATWRPFCPALNVLIQHHHRVHGVRWYKGLTAYCI